MRVSMYRQTPPSLANLSKTPHLPEPVLTNLFSRQIFYSFFLKSNLLPKPLSVRKVTIRCVFRWVDIGLIWRMEGFGMRFFSSRRRV